MPTVYVDAGLLDAIRDKMERLERRDDVSGHVTEREALVDMMDSDGRELVEQHRQRGR